MNRYAQLIDLIAEHRPSVLVEVGTHDGRRAVEMINAAKRWQRFVGYIGFDMFRSAGNAVDKINARELNVKGVHSKADAEDRIRRKSAVDWFHLVEGDTRSKHPHATGDLVFIDGGHSIATIASDFAALRHNRLIVLDDYYEPNSEGRRPDTRKFGCNQLVESLGAKATLLPVVDEMPEGGLVRMVLVRA